MGNTWRFINSGFQDASTNMAIDQALFLNFCEEKIQPTLRIYGWTPAALSLGYFQEAEKELDIERCARENIFFVKRITGGGIIFHDHELTYSLVCSPGDLEIQGSVENSFRVICAFLITAYRKMGLLADFAVGQNKHNKTDSFSSFCFSSRAKYDILVKGRKIGGNAQKRIRDVVFQHGSIPLSFDLERAVSFLKEKPRGLETKICSLREAKGEEISFDNLRDILKDSFRETFAVNLIEGGLSLREEILSRYLREYACSTTEAPVAG